MESVWAAIEIISLIFRYYRLYYTKIGIGTPPNNFTVQVDTGSDVMWVNCISCQRCPRRGYGGVRFF